MMTLDLEKKKKNLSKLDRIMRGNKVGLEMKKEWSEKRVSIKRVTRVDF